MTSALLIQWTDVPADASGAPEAARVKREGLGVNVPRDLTAAGTAPAAAAVEDDDVDEAADAEEEADAAGCAVAADAGGAGFGADARAAAAEDHARNGFNADVLTVGVVEGALAEGEEVVLGTGAPEGVGASK